MGRPHGGRIDPRFARRCRGSFRPDSPRRLRGSEPTRADASGGGESPLPSRSPPSPSSSPRTNLQRGRPRYYLGKISKNFKSKAGRQIGRKNGPERGDPVQGFAKLDHPVSRESAGKIIRGPGVLQASDARKQSQAGVRDDRGPGMIGPGRCLGLVVDRCCWHRVRNSTVRRSHRGEHDRLPDEHPDHHPEPSAAAALAQRAARIVSGASMFFPAPVSERLQLVRCIHTRRGTGLRPRMRNRLEYRHGEVSVHLSRIHGEPPQAVS